MHTIMLRDWSVLSDKISPTPLSSLRSVFIALSQTCRAAWTTLDEGHGTQGLKPEASRYSGKLSLGAGRHLSLVLPADTIVTDWRDWPALHLEMQIKKKGLMQPGLSIAWTIPHDLQAVHEVPFRSASKHAHPLSTPSGNLLHAAYKQSAYSPVLACICRGSEGSPL